MKTIQELQMAIGYEFKNESLLRQALTHSSYANEKHMKKLSDNERLEFLGDAVLETVSSEFLFLNYRPIHQIVIGMMNYFPHYKGCNLSCC